MSPSRAGVLAQAQCACYRSALRTDGKDLIRCEVCGEYAHARCAARLKKQLKKQPQHSRCIQCLEDAIMKQKTTSPYVDRPPEFRAAEYDILYESSDNENASTARHPDDGGLNSQVLVSSTKPGHQSRSNGSRFVAPAPMRAPTVPMMTAGAPATHLSYNHTTHAAQTAATTSGPVRVECDCARQPSVDDASYFACGHCLTTQHFGCSVHRGVDDTITRRFRCNKCYRKLVVLLEQPRKDIAQTSAQIEVYKRGITEHVIQTFVWRHYCLLPNSDTASVQLIQETRTETRRGRQVPVLGPPIEFILEVTTMLNTMEREINQEVYDSIMKRTWETGDWEEELLPGWRRLSKAWLKLGNGRTKWGLGLLGEVLDYFEKGEYWGEPGAVVDRGQGRGAVVQAQEGTDDDLEGKELTFIGHDDTEAEEEEVL